jgi:hypothetical protein
MSEPVDTQKLWITVVDTMYEHMPDDQMDWFEEHVELPVRALICEKEGHKVVDDQCGRPDHRYCLVCSVRQPNAEVNA